MPLDKMDLYFPFEDIGFEEIYFIYILVFYEDQDGNLYDTEHVLYLPFNEPEVKEDGLEVRLKKDGFRSETYNTYTGNDYIKLHEVLTKLENPINNYISR